MPTPWRAPALPVARFLLRFPAVRRPVPGGPVSGGPAVRSGGLRRPAAGAPLPRRLAPRPAGGPARRRGDARKGHWEAIGATRDRGGLLYPCRPPAFALAALPVAFPAILPATIRRGAGDSGPRGAGRRRNCVEDYAVSTPALLRSTLAGGPDRRRVPLPADRRAGGAARRTRHGSTPTISRPEGRLVTRRSSRNKSSRRRQTHLAVFVDPCRRDRLHIYFR